MSVVVYCKVTNWGKWFSRSISGSNTETSTMSTVILKAKAARVFTAICNPTYKPEKKLRERSRSSRFNTFFVKDGRSHVMCLSILGVDAQYVVGIQQLDTSNVREYWTVHFFRLMFLLRRIYCKANFATVYVKLTHQRILRITSYQCHIFIRDYFFVRRLCYSFSKLQLCWHNHLAELFKFHCTTRLENAECLYDWIKVFRL